MTVPTVDALTFGRRLRHHRKSSGYTLQELGERVGRPAPYLSMLENGRREPKLSHIAELAAALEIEIVELMDPEPPSRRAALEIELERMQADSRFERLSLPYIRPSPSLSDEVLQHLIGLYRASTGEADISDPGRSELRKANAAVGDWFRHRNGYLADVEDVAGQVLDRIGHGGEGPLSSRDLLDIAATLGFEIEAVEDMVPGVRSVTDTLNGRIYIAQRNELRTRQARKAILQTLAGRLLDHGEPADVEEHLRQRIETAYLATAILVPQDGAVKRLQASMTERDISIEDVKEVFYVSYEMAAWRFSNLATERLSIPSHLIVSRDDGIVVKGYTNDSLPFITDSQGGLESQPVCRRWGAAAVFDSEDKYDVHAQYTDTTEGTFFCVTHMEPDRPFSVTIGVPFDFAQWFRHRATERRAHSECPDPACCRRPTLAQSERWHGHLEVSVRSQARLLGRLASDPYPSPQDRRVYDLVEKHSG